MLFSLLALPVLLAGRVAALNIQFGGALGNITASQLLAIPDGPIKTFCVSQCDPATSAIQACGDTNNACLCANATVTPIVACEQCMFTELIAKNQKMPDPRAGSTPALAAYAAACLAESNITIVTGALKLPPNWDGPFDVVMGLPGTIITVGVGAVIGGGALYILSNI